MSGIAGYYCFKDSFQPNKNSCLMNMLDEMAVESPYDLKLCHESHGIGIGGFVAYDVSNVNGCEDEDLVVVFQGRLTNAFQLKEGFPQLKNGSVINESFLIKELYKKHGKTTASLLKGIFCFAILDKHTQKLFLAVDRNGHGYLYYYRTSHEFFFATEIKAILRVLDHTPQPNINGICDIHNFNTVFLDETPFKDIFLLPYGSVAQIDSNGITIEKYWEYPKTIDYYTQNENELIEQAKEILKNAIDKSLPAGPLAGVMISGGLDSRLLAGLLSNYYQEKNLKLFHINASSRLEVSIVKNISKELGIPLEILELQNKPPLLNDYLNEQIYTADGFSAFIDYLPCIKTIGENNRGICLLNGYLLDTMFKSGFAFFPKNEKDGIQVSINDYIQRHGFLGDYLVEEVFSHSFAEVLIKRKKERVEESLTGFEGAKATEASIRFYCINRGRRGIYHYSKLFGNYVHMALPGIDYDLQDFAMRLPYHLRNNTRFYRRIICELFPQLGSITWDKTGKPLIYGDIKKNPKISKYIHLSKHALQRATHGRIDMLNGAHSFDKRFRLDKKFRNQVCSILLDKKTLDRGFFNYTGMENLINRQLSGRDHVMLFKSILTVEFLYRRFIDG